MASEMSPGGQATFPARYTPLEIFAYGPRIGPACSSSMEASLSTIGLQGVSHACAPRVPDERPTKHHNQSAGVLATLVANQRRRVDHDVQTSRMAVGSAPS